MEAAKQMIIRQSVEKFDGSTYSLHAKHAIVSMSGGYVPPPPPKKILEFRKSEI